MSKSILHPRWCLSCNLTWYPDTSHVTLPDCLPLPPQMHNHIFSFLRSLPGPEEENNARPHLSRLALQLYDISLFRWIAQLYLFIMIKANILDIYNLALGKQTRVAGGISYLVLRIFRNCKISENCISLRALKNLKPGKRNETEVLFPTPGCHAHSLVSELQPRMSVPRAVEALQKMNAPVPWTGRFIFILHWFNLSW